MAQKTITVDFDGVCHLYSKGWKDGSIYDPPVPGVQMGLERLRRAGYRVVIYTTRASNRVVAGVLERGQAAEVAEYLNKHNIPFDEIFTGEKPIFMALIDDRAIRFNPKPFPRWIKWLFGTPWDACIRQLEKHGILKPGQGEEP